MEVHMRVQAGTKPVDESDRAQVQASWVCFFSTTRKKIRSARIERTFVALKVVAQTLRDRQNPLAPPSAVGKDAAFEVVAQCFLCVSGWGDHPGLASPIQSVSHQLIVFSFWRSAPACTATREQVTINFVANTPANTWARCQFNLDDHGKIPP